MPSNGCSLEKKPWPPLVRKMAPAQAARLAYLAGSTIGACCSQPHASDAMRVAGAPTLAPAQTVRPMQQQRQQREEEEEEEDVEEQPGLADTGVLGLAIGGVVAALVGGAVSAFLGRGRQRSRRE